MARPFLALALLSASLFLAACQSDEQVAEDHYQSALALMAEEDVDRALIELRNVFDHDGFHREARKLYADTMLARGDLSEAYGHYLLLVEQYPETVDARVALAEMAASTANWAEVERHGRAAAELAPDDPSVRAISTLLDYRTAVLDEDAAARQQAFEAAKAILAETPESGLARRVVIDSLIQGEDPAAALTEIDAAIEQEPQSLELQAMKFQLLGQTGDEAAAGAQLERMFELFPDDEEVRRTLIAWYMAQENIDGAEQILRDMAGPVDGEAGGHVTVVRFLEQARGVEAAMAELDRLIEAAGDSPNADVYRSLRATLVFDEGDRDAAIAEMEAIIDAAEPSDQTRGIKVMLARMLLGTGNPVGARALVEEVVEEDASNVAALKMRAAWAIQEDDPATALSDLNTALNQAPRDPEILTLMAEAHSRDGAHQLALDRLALAVEASGNAPGESLRYAARLTDENRLIAARAVLADARRVSPGNLELLGTSADLALRQEDWATVDEILSTLETIGTDEALALAENVRTARLMGQGNIEEVVTRLQDQIAAGGDDTIRATSLLVLTRVRDGDSAGARTALDAALAETPDSVQLRLLSADLALTMEDPEMAEAELRQVLSAEPENEAAILGLRRLLTVLDRAEEADAVLAEGLAAAPDSRMLQLVEAGRLEAEGDIDGAIAIYEELYAANTSDLIVANNLASLIGSHVQDEAALDRAASIARRLRDREIAPFQDTYGWIEYRRGNYEDALASLEPAAAGLPNDPLVQYHLGMTYVGLGRPAGAREALARALEIAGDSPLPQFDTARETLEGLPQGAEGAETPEETADQ